MGERSRQSRRGTWWSRFELWLEEHDAEMATLGLGLLLVVLLVGVLLVSPGCIEQTTLTTSAGPLGGVGAVPSSSIDNLRIEPSQFELVNGSRATAVVIGSVGGVEVRDFDFTASIAPNASVATIEQVSGNVILFKAENPGNTELRVVAGSSEAEATIRVVRAE